MKVMLRVKVVVCHCVNHVTARKDSALIAKKNLPISFKENVYGITRTRYGIRAGDKLIVVPITDMQTADVWQIYSLVSCKPFFNPGIYSRNFCIELSEWFDVLYQNYIPIQEVDGYSDVISLCRYTIKHGNVLAWIHQQYANEVLTKAKFKSLFGCK